jgi:L-threonylcarbamoyladenylate synthase
VKTVLTESPSEAARFIKLGGAVAFPTETVYGLGADVFDEAAIRRIFEAKDRPGDNPLIAHVSDLDQIHRLTPDTPSTAQRLIDSFFPGPLTIVLRKSERVPLIATAGLDTIGIRMPKLPLAQKFLAACGVPVVAPSANLSGRPSPTTWQAVLEDLDGRIECILKGEATEIGLESTVVDCTSEQPVLLRKGAISLEALRTIVPEIKVLEPGDKASLRSPGLRHKHYSPRAEVIVVRPGAVLGPREADAFIGIHPASTQVAFSRVCDSVEDYAASLFEFFRECDRLGVQKIYCEAVNERGIGAALMDRIRRAAES